MPQKRKFFAGKPKASRSLRRRRPCFCETLRKKFAQKEKTGDCSAGFKRNASCGGR